MDSQIDESQRPSKSGKKRLEKSPSDVIGQRQISSTSKSRQNDRQASTAEDGQFLPKYPSRVRDINNAQTIDEIQQISGGLPKIHPKYKANQAPQMSTYPSKNTLVERSTVLGESYDINQYSRYQKSEISEVSKKQLHPNKPGQLYQENKVENYIDQDLRKPKRKKFKNQDMLEFQFNQRLDPFDETFSKPAHLFERKQEDEAVEKTYALMRNKTQKPEDFKYDTGFIFGKNFAKDEKMQNLFRGLVVGENVQEESTPQSPQPNRKSFESPSFNDEGQTPSTKRQAQAVASPKRKPSEKKKPVAERSRPFEKWPTVQELIKKAREAKKEAGNEEVEAHASSNTGTPLEQILRRLPPEYDFINHEDFLGKPESTIEGLMDNFARRRAHCYEIKPKVDFSNTEIMYTKRYFLPAIFGRFYTVQIERFTKSIQKEFDEMVKQNAYFNDRINETFEGALRELQDYDDPDYVESITCSIGEQKKFAQKIQERMHSKFQEKQRVIQNYGTEDFREIYEYKVHLYAYDLSASDKVNSRFPQLNEQKLKASMNSVSRAPSPGSQGGAEKATGAHEEPKASPQGDFGGRNAQKDLSGDNLIIEPVASIQLAKFYSIEDQDNGLMFHKNLCDSFKVNEKQGALYILMQEKKKELFANQEGNVIKFVTRKLNYDQTELQNMDDFLHSTSPLVHHDLQELRNLKYKVLTYGSNSLAPNDADYHDKFFMTFPEKDIMSNCQMFALPKQLSKFVDQETREAEARQDEKRNLGEVEILEQQVVVTAKFVNPTKIKYEFRMLRNFQKVFEKEVRYKNLDSYDHGFERIQAFSEVKRVNKVLDGQRVDVEITVNVVDKQMINQYLASFQRMPDSSLEFVGHEHQISYRNMLEGMDFTGRLVYDQQKYETYLISDELDFNQDINRDIRQRFRVQKLHTKESFEKQKHKKRAQLDQSGQSIYLEHDRILVNVASQTEIDLDKMKRAQADRQTFEDLEELCSTNRLRNKFPQLRRELLQAALNRWLPGQGFLRLRRGASRRFLQRNKIEERVYVNSVELSSDHSYLLVGIHVVEYLNDKARRAHVNKDIVISLQDLRSVTENQNPGFVSRPIVRDEIEPLVPIDPLKYPAAKLEVEHVKRKALEVQQHLSLVSKMRMREVQEFEIYQEETVNPHDLDQRVLNYLKKTIDLFEYVNRVEILQFQENWKPANPHMLDKQRIVNVRSQNYSQFEKTISFKNLTILVLVDESYLVSIRQTVVSVKRRDLVFEVKYFCPVYSDKLENPSPTNDPYNPDASPEFYEGQALQVSDMYDCLEFYSQVKSYEESQGMADSRQKGDVQRFFGTYEDKAHVALKVLDRLSRQEKVFCGKLDRKAQTLEVYTTKLTVLDLFNQDLANGQLLPVQQLMSVDASPYVDNVLDMRLNFQHKSITIILALKSGHVDMHEVIKVEDDVVRPINEFRLVQSSSICLFQMQNGNIHSQINSHEDYSQQIQFLKCSKLLRHEDENYMPEMFANITADRKLVIFTIMLDERRNQRLEPWEKPRLKYYAVELDLEALNKNLSCSARHYKVKNYVLTHQNGYGILYGCKDEPVMLQHHPFSQELVTVVGARLSMVDFSRELMFQEATKTMNHARMREWLNKRTQTAFFSEREKLRVSGDMHLAMRNMKRNIMFGDLVQNLEGFNGKTASQAIRAQFHPQEFLFGQVGLATMLHEPSRLGRIVESATVLGPEEQVEVIRQLCLRRDCNLGTLTESCISGGHATSLRIILGSFMANHGPLRALSDQEAVKSLQRLLNELSPLVLQNQGIADFLTNLKHFRFGVFSSKLESEDHQRIWSDEAQLAKYPNQNLPEDHLLTIEDFAQTAKQRNVTDVLPLGSSQIFAALREKLFEQRGSMAKTNGFLRKSKCAKSCLRQGKTPSDASNLGSKEYPSFLNQYHVIDFKLVEYGYKRVQKLYARREYRDYQPIHLRNVEEQRQAKLAAEATRKKIQDAINWVKSLREESEEERAQRLEREAAAQKKEEEKLAKGEDEDGQNELLYEDWVPKTANQRLAATLPHYIEPFSERKVTDMMTHQISDFLAGHELQARLNESTDTEASKILYPKDIEAFVLHQWKATAARLELSRHIFTLACFLVPFMVDGYAAARDYEMLDARADYSEADSSLTTTDVAEVQYGLKGVGIFATLSLLVFELIKAAASDRNKYAGMLTSQSHDVTDGRANAINVSFFNVFLFIIYVSWSVGSVSAQIEIGKFKQAAADKSQSAEDLELLANDINWNQQILQLLHIVLLIFSFLMALEMLQMVSKNVHRTIEVLKHNFKRFTSLSVIFLIFNITIGVSSKWNSQISTGFGTEIDTSKEGFVTASWEEVGSFYKAVRVFTGGVVFEFLNYSNDRSQLQRFWVVSALQVACQIYIVIFMLALLFTFVETAIQPRSLKHDKYDLKFLTDKNLQNLEYQELEAMLTGANQWMRLTYRRAKFVTSVINRIKRAWKKFMGELGIEETVPLQRLKADSSKYLVFSFRI